MVKLVNSSSLVLPSIAVIFHLLVSFGVSNEEQRTFHQRVHYTNDEGIALKYETRQDMTPWDHNGKNAALVQHQQSDGSEEEEIIQETTSVKKEEEKQIFTCYDLSVAWHFWTANCDLKVMIENIGTQVAIANIPVALDASQINSGDTFEWYMANLTPGSTGLVTFSNINSMGPTVDVMVDALNFHGQECSESNNGYTVSVPSQCIGGILPDCYNVYLTGSNGLQLLDTETLTTTTINPIGPGAIAFAYSGLYGIDTSQSYPFDQLNQYNIHNGNILSTLQLSGATVPSSLSGHPTDINKLVVPAFQNPSSSTLMELRTINVFTGTVSTDASIPNSEYSDPECVAFNGSIYSVINAGWFWGQNNDDFVSWTPPFMPSTSYIANIPTNDYSALVEVGNVGGSEIWGINHIGEIFRIDPVAGSETYIGTIPGNPLIYDAASRPCALS